MSRSDKYLFIFLCFFMVLANTSCKDRGSDSLRQQLLTESDFLNNPGLRADLSGGVLETFLEHPESSADKSDSGVRGRDVIPLTYGTTTSHTFCWEDQDKDSRHFMTLNDINGIEIIRVLANDDCVTEIIHNGDYDMILHHDGRINKTFAIFIERQETEPENFQTLIKTNFDSLPTDRF